MHKVSLNIITTRTIPRFYALPGFCRVGGFSVLELMVTLSLMAIFSALAIPSYHDMVEKRRITHGAETIVSFVSKIQSEAIKQNRLVTVSYSTSEDGGWCIGAVLNQNPCDCKQTDELDPGFCAIDSVPWVLRDSDVLTRNLVSSMTGDGFYAFDPVRGIFLDPGDSLVIALQSPGDQFQMNLSVISTGKITLCLPSLSHKIPGFSTCA